MIYLKYNIERAQFINQVSPYSTATRLTFKPAFALFHDYPLKECIRSDFICDQQLKYITLCVLTKQDYYLIGTPQFICTPVKQEIAGSNLVFVPEADSCLSWLLQTAEDCGKAASSKRA